MEQKQKQSPGWESQSDENPGDRNEDLRSEGTRQYEGGKNPNMQSQRSNRQGDGRPTQQRKEDR